MERMIDSDFATMAGMKAGTVKEWRNCYEVKSEPKS